MKKKNLVIILILAIIISVAYNINRSRKSSTTGFQSGSQKIPESLLRNYYVFRFDTVKGIDNKTTKKPLYAILWKAQPASASYSSSWHLVKMINDGKISIPQNEKAIYSLQPDFTLSILPLKEVELNSLFELFLSTRKIEPFYNNSIWQSQIAPNLMIVEVPEK